MQIAQDISLRWNC